MGVFKGDPNMELLVCVAIATQKWNIKYMYPCEVEHVCVRPYAGWSKLHKQSEV